MQTIDITETLPLTPERVFDLLADHANYHRFPGVTASELLKEGEPAPNGLGAIRRVALGGLEAPGLPDHRLETGRGFA